MIKKKKHCGVVVPMVTPFKENGQFDEFGASRIVEHLLEAGTYPFILGTTGESASIPFETRLQIVKHVVKYVSGRTLIYAGISDNCLESSLNFAKNYYDWGVDVFVAHLPSYYPLTPDHILKYYETLAESSPGPIMLYNVTITTHTSIPLDVVEKLSHHPNIIGIKDSERDLDRIKASVEMFADRSDFSLFIGWSDQSANALLAGYDGIVPNPGNIVPQMYKKLYDAAVSGDREQANKMQAITNTISNIFQKDTIISWSIPRLKIMMSELGLCETWVLPPLSRLSPREEKNIKIEMEKLGLLSKRGEIVNNV